MAKKKSAKPDEVADDLVDETEDIVDDDLVDDVDIEEIEEEEDVEDDQFSAFFDAELKAAKRVTGRHDLLVADESEHRRYGIEIPSLALQFVCQANVLFMESLTLVAGKAASHKSSFAFEVARWVLNSGGFARLFNTEGGKYNPRLPLAVIGRELINKNSWQVIDCENINQWQAHFNTVMASYRKFYKVGKKLKKGETRPPLMPVAMVIDSLTGRGTEKTAAYFDKKGESANTQGAQIAKSITDFLQNQDFGYLPWFIFLIRHEKDGGIGSSFMSAPQKSTPGGKAPDFLGGFDFRFFIRERYRERKDFQYNVVGIKCRKNAFGADNLSCDVRFSWEWVDNDEGEAEQIPKWEWDLATAQFLANFDRADIKDICHVIVSGTKPDPRFSCKQLGLSEVDGDTLGAAVRQDKQIYQDLQNYLHIDRWPVFDPYMDMPDE